MHQIKKDPAKYCLRLLECFCNGNTFVQNILIFQDLMRLYNWKNTSSSFLIKIDLKKTYDSLEWEFVEEMIYRLTFHIYTKWVMECITTPQYSIAINGEIHGYFLHLYYSCYIYEIFHKNHEYSSWFYRL